MSSRPGTETQNPSSFESPDWNTLQHVLKVQMEPEKSFNVVAPLLVSLPSRVIFPFAHLSVHQTKKDMFWRSNNEAEFVKPYTETKKEWDKKSPFKIT